MWDVDDGNAKEVTTRQFGRQSTLAIGSQGEIVVGDGDELKFFTADQFALGDPAPPSSVLSGALAPNQGVQAKFSNRLTVRILQWPSTAARELAGSRSGTLPQARSSVRASTGYLRSHAESRTNFSCRPMVRPRDLK